MPQTGANVPSSSVGFPKTYLKTLRIKLLNIILRFQGAANDPSLHPGTSGFKSLKLINFLIAINIVSFLRRIEVGSLSDRAEITKPILFIVVQKFKLQTVMVFLIIA